MASSFLRFLDHTQRRITVGRTPLDEWSARLRDLYLTTHNTHNRKTSMPPVGFEPTISADERPQTYILDRAATGTGLQFRLQNEIVKMWPHSTWLAVKLLQVGKMCNDNKLNILMSFPWNFRQIILMHNANTKIWTRLIDLKLRIGLGSGIGLLLRMQLGQELEIC